MIRTHTGRTRRLYGEPAQTETSFVTPNDDAVSGIRDSTFSADRNEKDGRLSAADDRESGRTELRKSKPKQIGKLILFGNLSVVFVTVGTIIQSYGSFN